VNTLTHLRERNQLLPPPHAELFSGAGLLTTATPFRRATTGGTYRRLYGGALSGLDLAFCSALVASCLTRPLCFYYLEVVELPAPGQAAARKGFGASAGAYDDLVFDDDEGSEEDDDAPLLRFGGLNRAVDCPVDRTDNRPVERTGDRPGGRAPPRGAWGSEARAGGQPNGPQPNTGQQPNNGPPHECRAHFAEDKGPPGFAARPEARPKGSTRPASAPGASSVRSVPPSLPAAAAAAAASAAGTAHPNPAGGASAGWGSARRTDAPPERRHWVVWLSPPARVAVRRPAGPAFARAVATQPAAAMSAFAAHARIAAAAASRAASRAVGTAGQHGVSDVSDGVDDGDGGGGGDGGDAAFGAVLGGARSLVCWWGGVSACGIPSALVARDVRYELEVAVGPPAPPQPTTLTTTAATEAATASVAAVAVSLRSARFRVLCRLHGDDGTGAAAAEEAEEDEGGGGERRQCAWVTDLKPATW